MSCRLGSSTEKIGALNDYAKSPLFNDAEKVALEYADAITDTYRDVDDELFARLATTLRRRHHRGADDDHRVGERVLTLQPGVPHSIARVLEAMTASDGFAEFLSDQLALLGRITLRRMFGKTGGGGRRR